VALVERERELAAVDEALDRAGEDGGVLLLEGPPGIGKSALLGQLRERAAGRGRRVLRARGSEMEREFGFGVVRQLFGPALRGLDGEERARLFAGPAALAAAIFGFGGGDADLELGGATEAALYGLFWMLAALAERGPVALAIDDAHWSDGASLRFVRYLGQRLEGLPVLVALTARPREPGAEAEALRALAAEPGVAAVRPAALSAAATATLVRERLGEAAAPLAAACHEVSGGNPLLLSELLVEVESAAGGAGAATAEGIATMGSERIAAAVAERAGRLGPSGLEVARAAAVLGDGSDLRAVAELASLERARAAELLDGLAAAAVLDGGAEHAFLHPLLRAAVYEAIPEAARSEAHRRAAALLRSQGAEPEAVAAHLLLSRPGGVDEALATLEAAADKASARGAPESAVAYLRRALPEAAAADRQAELLHRLGGAEVAIRDPGAIEHLARAAELTADSERALAITLELIELLSVAGLWETAVAAIDAAFARFGDEELPELLDLEALRAASRGYDPAMIDLYEAEEPRLLELVAGRGEEATHLRWVLAGVGSTRRMTREQVLELVGPARQEWSFAHKGRESTMVGQASLAVLIVDALELGDPIAVALERDGQRRGSMLAMISGAGYRAALEQRRGRLDLAEAGLATAIKLLRANELSLMALTTFFHHCTDTILERRALAEVGELVIGLEVPPPFDRTVSGGWLLELRAALRSQRGEREAALADLRGAAAILRPLGSGPRMSSFRSRLALALPESEREEALALATEELELAREVASPRAVGTALRTLGALRGGGEGIETLRESLAVLEGCPSPYERGRSLAELGAALRRDNRRVEAREVLREAFDLAQRCGAERLEEQVAEELRVAGAKPRRRALSGPGSLTPAERRVAATAAAGASNREIGQTLFVSLRTVEMHLTNTYRKLGISSRAELATALGEDIA
jgi:DNA-binding CsgD family transcriptional regulator